MNIDSKTEYTLFQHVIERLRNNYETRDVSMNKIEEYLNDNYFITIELSFNSVYKIPPRINSILKRFPFRYLYFALCSALVTIKREIISFVFFAN